MFNFFKKENIWKAKAKIKSSKIRNLKKDNLDLKKSRDKWKEKALHYKELRDELEKELKKN